MYFRELLFLVLFLAFAQAFYYRRPRLDNARCVPVDIQQCKKLGYNQTRPVDLYSAAGRNIQSGKIFIQMIDATPCSRFALFFLCSVYSPVCMPGHTEPIKPCQTVCHIVKKRCSPVMRKYDIDWPEELNCDHLPEHNSGVCIQPSVFFIGKTGRGTRRIKDSSRSNQVKCNTCNKSGKHAKFRHFRRADYVIEAEILSRATTANGHTKLYVNITKIIKHGQVSIKIGKTKLWAPTKCLCPMIDFEKKYIIMGSEQTTHKKRLLFDKRTHVIPVELGKHKVKKWQEKCVIKKCFLSDGKSS